VEKHSMRLAQSVPMRSSLWNLLEHVDMTGQAVSTSLYGLMHHVCPVHSEGFYALQVRLDTGLYALYQRARGVWFQV